MKKQTARQVLQAHAESTYQDAKLDGELELLLADGRASEIVDDLFFDVLKKDALLKAAVKTLGRYDGAVQFYASVLSSLNTSDVAARNRKLMFGENDEAFPTREEWSRCVD